MTMFRAIAMALLVLLALHFLGIVGLVGWLGATGRLSEDRAREVLELFELTVAEQEQREREREQEEEAAREDAERAARLEAVADGPQTLRDRLARQQQAEEIAMHRVERLQRETGDLRHQIERAKQIISDQKAQLDAEREAFEAAVREHNEQREDEDFQQTVRMYEQLRPNQVKQMFQELIEDGEVGRVVDYLAEMQLRRAGRVIEQFETPEEIRQATDLLERLRERGVYPLANNAIDDGQEDERT